MAQDFVRELEAAKNEDVTIRLNTSGGDPLDAWSCLAKVSEHKKGKTVKVDGKALSAGFFFCCYAKDVECLDVSEFLVHRAAYSAWYEREMSEEERNSVKNTNANLRKAMEAKINVAKFEALKGVTLDQLFSMESRIDVTLTAQEALAIGLVNKINTITPALAAQINARVDEYRAKAAKHETDLHVKAAEVTTQVKPENMTIETLKAQHPAVYNAIFAEGKQAGVTEELDRVKACLVFNEIDPKGVKEAIQSGKPLSAQQMAEFVLKQNSPEALAKLAESSTKPIETPAAPEGEKPEEAKELEKSTAVVRELLGLKTQTKA